MTLEMMQRRENVSSVRVCCVSVFFLKVFVLCFFKKRVSFLQSFFAVFFAGDDGEGGEVTTGLILL